MTPVMGTIHPDQAHLLHSALDHADVHGQVHFGGGGDGPNVPPDHQLFTVTVQGGVESLQALHGALQQLGIEAWVPQAAGPLEPLGEHLSHIEWR